MPLFRARDASCAIAAGYLLVLRLLFPHLRPLASHDDSTQALFFTDARDELFMANNCGP